MAGSKPEHVTLVDTGTEIDVAGATDSVSYSGSYTGTIVDENDPDPDALAESDVVPLDLEEFLTGGEPKTRIVRIPEFGGKAVECCALTSGQQEQLNRLTRMIMDRDGNTEVKMETVRGQALLWCVRDVRTHRPFFTKAHLLLINSKDAAIVTRLYGVIQDLSIVPPDELKEVSKNFLRLPGSSSSSSSR